MAENPSEELADLRSQITALSQRISHLEHLAYPQGGIGYPSATPATSALPEPASAVPGLAPSEPVPASHPKSLPPPLYIQKIPSETLESRIGTHWLNRIGIVAVLVGVSYSLKIAFEKDIIGVSGRIAIGLLAGIGLVVWSESFRKKGYEVFSYSLKAVGIGIMYLSLWAAFHLYQLIPGPVAFAAMIVVTAATAILAVRQEAQVLAAFAIAGGFITPFLLSTGQDREVELFTYLAILDLATVALVAFRPWALLLLGSLSATGIYFVGWYSQFYRNELEITWGFATAFFFILAAAPLAVKRSRGLRETSRQLNILLAVALLNAAIYFLEVNFLLRPLHQPWIAWIAVALGGLYLVLSQLLRSAEAPLLFWVHVAIAVGFLTIAIPLKLDNHWITIGWLVEAAALLYVGKRGNSRFLKGTSVAALGLGVIRLLFIDNYSPETPIFNARFATYMVAVIVLALIVTYWREDGPSPLTSSKGENQGLGMAIIAINILLLTALTYEVHDYFYPHLLSSTLSPPNLHPATDWQMARSTHIACNFSYSALWMIYGAALMIIGFWKQTAFLRWQALVLIAITIGKVFLYDIGELNQGYRVLSFILLGILLLGVSFAYQRDWLKLSHRKPALPNGTGV